MPQIEISDSAFAFLQRHAVPFTDTPADVLDRLFAGLETPPAKVAPSDPPVVQVLYQMSEVPAWTEVSLRRVRLDEVETRLTGWHDLLSHLFVLGMERGLAVNGLSQCIEGFRYSDDGWDYEEDVMDAILGMSEEEARSAIAELAAILGVRLDALVSWQPEEIDEEEIVSARLILASKAA